MNPRASHQCIQPDSVSHEGEEGYISANIAKETGEGSLDCPWTLTGQRGQQINISLIDFHPDRELTGCTAVAYIVDGRSKDKILPYANQTSALIMHTCLRATLFRS